MAILLALSLIALGFILGLALAAWMLRAAGYSWPEVVRRWQVDVVMRRNRRRWEQEFRERYPARRD